MLEQNLSQITIQAIRELYQQEIPESQIQIQKTKKEFEGDFTLVVFPFTKISRKSPEQTGEELGNYLQKHIPEIEKFNIVKGFLNLVYHAKYWKAFLTENSLNTHFGIPYGANRETIVVEYSSPNTNKPLHLGHIRNNLLGWSVSEILKANGWDVKKVNLVNDRGIHICKSMLAWIKFGNGETPESGDLKGDHLVGKYYVLFDKYYKEQIKELVAQGKEQEEAEKTAPILLEAQEMLRKWEANDEETIRLWKTMNAWVYAGFDDTYKKLGVDFDKIYYESDTYLLGKEIVQKGLADGHLYQKENQSVWADLTTDGLDEKLLLRADGTSVYMTQDLGTALLRHREFNAEKLVYVVGNEQNYHFDVLKIVLKRLGYSWAEKLYHLSYGMVELPEGKMKSREGTVVDADDLIAEMIETARKNTVELGKTQDFTPEEAENLYRILALGALKYFMLKVDPVKNMLFNPKESIDFNGNTGPFIQYTHARIKSLLRKAKEQKNIDIKSLSFDTEINMQAKEKSIIRLLYDFPETVKQAGEGYSPAVIANYAYELAKEFNGFYQDIPVLKEADEKLIIFRLHLAYFTAYTLKNAMHLLGIEVPEKM